MHFFQGIDKPDTQHILRISLWFCWRIFPFFFFQHLFEVSQLSRIQFSPHFFLQVHKHRPRNQGRTKSQYGFPGKDLNGISAVPTGLHATRNNILFLHSPSQSTQDQSDNKQQTYQYLQFTGIFCFEFLYLSSNLPSTVFRFHFLNLRNSRFKVHLYLAAMEASYLDEEFDGRVFVGDELQGIEFENCHFTRCNFESLSFQGSSFINCRFQDCNLSNVKLTKTSFQDVQFSGCKMLGLQFDQCNGFGFAIQVNNCLLTHSNFFQMDLRNSSFLNSQLHGVDFSEAKLSGSKLNGSDLLDAVFEFSDLEKANFSDCINLRIDPTKNKLKGALIPANELAGLLYPFQIRVV